MGGALTCRAENAPACDGASDRDITKRAAVIPAEAVSARRQLPPAIPVVDNDIVLVDALLSAATLQRDRRKQY
jgi:hypothetical protein